MAGAGGERELRAGLIGYGLGGSAFHAPVIDATPGVRVAAIVTRDRERRERALRRHPGASVVERVERLWALRDELDFVVVATPNRTHVPLALAALEAGLPVVVDKPIAATAEDARALVARAERRGLLLTVYQNRRWDGDFLTLRQLVEQGALGDVLRFESRFERWRPTPKTGWRQRGAPEEAGGILYDLGSHLVDQALALFGPVTHVYAELDRRRPGVEVDDDAFVALTHASGTRSHLWMSAVAAQSGPRMRVLGSRAGWTKHGTDVQEEALRAGVTPGDDWGREPERSWGLLGAEPDLRPVPTETGDYRGFYEALARALREDGPPPVDPADAVEGLRLIEAARRSAAEGRTVRLT